DAALSMPTEDTVPCEAVSLDGVKAALRAELDGKTVTFVDYASAGATWDEDSAYRSWIPIRS
ncbi:MAG: hypothetical protein MJ175_10720, partial [Clostridia bacterium]|nr:hypothetical protein [Clostridia bacterium]